MSAPLGSDRARTRRIRRAGCAGASAIAVLAASAALCVAAAGAAEEPLDVGPTNEAAEAEAEAPIEEFIVMGEAAPTMDVLAGATATRIETDLRLLEGQQLADLLAEVPGVQIRRFGGVGERFEISIRGSRPEQVPVFLDGARLDTALTGASDLSTVCLDVLEEVQVVRGAGAARAGTGAIGGVVNLRSRRAGERPETRLRVAGGNFGTLEGSVRHARRIGEWDGSLAYCGFHTDGDFRFQSLRSEQGGVLVGDGEVIERINNEADRHTVLAHGGGPLGPGALRLTQLATHLERGAPGLESDQRPRSQERYFSTLSSATYDLPLARVRDARLDFGLSHRFEQSDYRDPDAFVGGDPIDSETGVDTLSARSGGRIERALLGGQHAFSLLAELRSDQRRSNEANSKSRTGYALRSELESSFLDRRIELSPSLRLEHFEGLDPEWIPGLHLRVHPLEFVELRAAAARSYRVPSFQELYLPDRGFERGNENLDPEDALSGEVGLRITSPFAADWLDFELDATLFASRIEDSIAFQLVSTNVVAPRNTGDAETRGYELALRYSPHPWLRLFASRTVTRSELEDTGDPVPGIAASLTDARVELGPADFLKLVGELHYTGRIYVSDGGIASLASRLTFDASASVDLTQLDWLALPRSPLFPGSLWLSLRGRNLSNESVRDGRYFPRPGRNFAVALEAAFR